ncbi:LLM class flavin-dependent oxidoreductase [Leptospira santarosai]|uniref:LLM class flavin-dependent oxidoreductase n=1 Tax=Leptospira santarosai TaxID=28183 RepID=UPI0002981DB9|nr:LLM class flavin-dependent oxidoreductase [Leptospira santarosai]EKS08115.1 putative alkanal monooxygenase alpha chain [Leptospira santarosai str. JET]EMP82338.1 putative alkanal monooxygenase alpha chain [Leptospira santarosai str. CBC1531]MDI7198168.1 LLM class flavin-dependent oxidoreductase [Leptospira santarosai]MDI7203704.1 LLM class flavin-dependent oxidoreductase [Leptospira santarosai]MDI7237944.1 LLM class flavin-dependent oxidoreductase [Leptospira santarosai]
MKWGVALTTYKPPQWDQRIVFKNSLEIALKAEELGYDDLWVLEHHFTEYGLCSDAMLMSGYLLGMTSRIKVGTAIVVAPLVHPVRLVEQVNLLDQMSRGRFIAGFGRGFFPLDFQIYGVDVTQNHKMLQEWIEIMFKTWENNGRISWESDLIQFPEISVYPEKYTKPRPPVYVVGESPSTIEWAATVGIPIIMNIPQSIEQVKAKLETYDEIAEANNHDPSQIKHIISAVVHVADSKEQASHDIVKNIENWHDDAMKVAFSVDQLRKLPNYRFHFSQFQDAILNGESDASVIVKKALDISPIGTADDCIEAFEYLKRETGVEHYICGFEGTLERNKILDSMQRFSEEVIPKFEK